MSGRTPMVFVSYAWEDDVRVWVRDLATRLRREGGVDVKIDQWDVAPGDPLPAFMERAVRTSDFILMICTPKYKTKSDERQGGVGYEGHIITGEIFAKANHRKFIPVLRKGEWTAAAPSFLQGNAFLDFRGDPYNEATYGQLLRALHRQSPISPTIGSNPALGGGTAVTGSTSPAPSFPSAATANPIMGTTIKRSALWPWLIALAAIIVAGSVLFAFLAGRVSEADTSAAKSTATDVCCGGVDCPKEQQQTEGTSCARPDACRPCKSGRRRVAGGCADAIPSTNTYRLRLAGVTTPGYHPGVTDTICVQLAGATPVCAMVSDANASPVLGLTRMADLTANVDVWFDRGKTRMRFLRGMRVQRPMSQFMNSALCVGAVLYSADESDIVRFYLDDP